MDRTACTEPQCLYNGALYLIFCYTQRYALLQSESAPTHREVILGYLPTVQQIGAQTFEESHRRLNRN